MSEQNNHTEDYRRIKELSGKLKMPDTSTYASAWSLLSKHITTQQKVISLNGWLKVAASLTIFTLSTFILYRTQEVSIYVANAEQREVRLPDKSTIKLNAQSSLSYNRFSWNFNRRVSFEGEGFFQITKGSTFSIHSSAGTTYVLGTSFNIYARQNEYKVSCTTGKVQVAIKDQNHILTPGLEASSIHPQLLPSSFETTKTLAWQRGEFYFEAMPLQKVFDSIERQYNVKIRYENVDLNRLYTGFFNNKDIDEALKVVCLPMGLTFKIIDKERVTIYNERKV